MSLLRPITNATPRPTPDGLRALVTVKRTDPAIDEALASLSRKLPPVMIDVVQAAQPARIVIAKSHFHVSAAALDWKLAGTAAAALAAGAATWMATRGFSVPAATLVMTAAALGVGQLADAIPVESHPLVDLGAQITPDAADRNGYAGEGAVVVGTSPVVRCDETEVILVHELGHVIDACLARHGWLSDEEQFRAIWDATCAASARGYRVPAFPNDYAKTDAGELFAEALCSYLDVSSAGSHMGRDELRERNPALYSYFERLFSERIPEALRDGSVQRFGNAVPSLGNARIPRKGAARTADDWLIVARQALSRAELGRDTKALAEAEQLFALADKSRRDEHPWTHHVRSLFDMDHAGALAKRLALVTSALARGQSASV